MHPSGSKVVLVITKSGEILISKIIIGWGRLKKTFLRPRTGRGAGHPHSPQQQQQQNVPHILNINTGERAGMDLQILNNLVMMLTTFLYSFIISSSSPVSSPNLPRMIFLRCRWTQIVHALEQGGGARPPYYI